MDYAPTTLYMKNNYYWALIDDALRNAAFQRKLEVKLLMGRWVHTYPEFYAYLHSLQDVNASLACPPNESKYCKSGSIEVRLFEVPPYNINISIPYSRVNHAKFMVTDNAAYIGTSNWSGDYFISTGGIGMIIQSGDSSQPSQRVQDLENVFERDWDSKYSSSINDYDLRGNPINS